MCVLLGDFDPRITESLNTCHHAVLDKRIHTARIAGLEVALHREVLNAGTETGCERAGIKLSDRCRPASTGANTFPARFDV